MNIGETDHSPLGEEQLHRLLEATEMLVALIDLGGRFSYVSPASRRLLGYEPRELVGRPGTELIPPGLVREALENFRSVRDGEERLRQRLLVRRRDGAHVHLRVDATPVRSPAGAVEGIAVVAHDLPRERVTLSGRHPAEADESELVERLPVVVYVAAPGAGGRWRFVSGRIESMLGYTPAEWMATPGLWAQRLHPDDRDRVLAEEERDARRGTAVASEYRLIARDGRVVWVRDEAVLRRGPDGAPYYDGLLIDVTERKALEDKLEFFADHDALTGLLNRRRIMAEIDAELKRLRRHGGQSSILVADLDDLKHINDTRGHAVGDLVICVAGEVMVERLRESDSVGRVGGDEFVALLRGADAAHAADLAQDLVDAMRERETAVVTDLSGAEISIGVAGLEPEHEVTLTLNAADAAMYEAKRAGGGRVATAPGRGSGA